jgi:mono/diheme cytochrome c family protein
MKMNKIYKIVGNLSVLAVTGLLMFSCTSNPDSAGLEYMPDMYRSPAIEAYVDYGEVRGVQNDAMKNSQSALTPPKHTIPFVGTDTADVLMSLPYHRLPSSAFAQTHGLFGWDFTKNNTADYEYNESAKDKNPYKLTAANSEAIFKKGKELYTANCQHCHGEKGDGNGPMVTSGAYAGVPNYSDRAALGDGQLFYSIYYGKGAMGGHASLVSKKEIWTLVHYIRKFQNSAYGTFNADGSSAAVATAAPADSTKTAAPKK